MSVFDVDFRATFCTKIQNVAQCFLVFASSVSFAADLQLEPGLVLPLEPLGMTVSPKGTFLISGRSLEGSTNQIIEISKSGEIANFPPESVKRNSKKETFEFDSIDGLQSDKNGVIWMLDNGRRSELPPKIVAWDYQQKRLKRVFNLVAPSVLPGSQLHDLAVDPNFPFIYLADPANGMDAALVVLDLTTGQARRLLQGHPSVVPVAGLRLEIDGQNLHSTRLDGRAADPQGGVNPLVVDKKGEWLYFAPLRSKRLYRIKTEHLRNDALSAEDLAGLIEEYAEKPLCDGITIDAKGNVFISDLASKSIGVISAETRKYSALVTDSRLLWPDGLCFGLDGKLYFFTNELKATPERLRSATPTSSRLFKMETSLSGLEGG